ncbi:hypothetical protein [Helicobacter typhlonius]|uniref:hypothetical protein n=1 Tax=Helicobacter typhlonius TaxID=76936 RepID=UPI002FE271CB
MPVSHPFAPLLGLSTPTLIYPATLPKPPTPFIPYGFNIEAQTLLAPRNPKAIVIFVGGFCDTIMCAVYRSFMAFNQKSCIKIYASFKSQALFSAWLPLLVQCNLPMFVIAHSWGGSNFYKALLDIESKNANNDVNLHYLLTLDPVGYHKPKVRPLGIGYWENVYIAHKHTYLRRTNIIALIGHAWNEIAVSDSNFALYKPLHHASIEQMIAATHFADELTKIISI